MKFRKSLLLYSGLFFCTLIWILSACGEGKKENISETDNTGEFFIGWALTDITPDKPVLLSGQFHARISEGIMDPVTATALAIESGTGQSSEKTLMISCDLISVSDDLRDNVRELLKGSLPDLKPDQVILSATHTHTAPYCSSIIDSKSIYGIDLDAMSPSDCQKYISERIAKAAEQAWRNRKPGGISYGLGHAVIGHNRLQVDFSGRSLMSSNTNKQEFSHLEGYEDHSVNLLFTWDKDKKLTGIIINVPCPSQVSEHEYFVSSDYWHDTRLEIHKRIGKDVYILPQCSAAGDQEPHIMVGEKGEDRMQRLMFSEIKSGKGSPGRRKQIAFYISDAVTSVLPYMKDKIDWDPVFEHRIEKAELSRRLISSKDLNSALKEEEGYKKQYEKLLQEIKDNPSIKEKPRWYTIITSTYTKMRRGYSVKDR
jgi:hypothetical protein